MAGCLPCFIIPLLLFIFHRFIQPIILRYWNPWEDKKVKQAGEKEPPVKTDTDGTETIADNPSDKLKTS